MIEVFYASAKSYCQWTESEPLSEREEAHTARRLLIELYRCAIDLPEVDPPDEDAENMSHSEWIRVFRRFGALPFNYYSVVFNPLVVPPEEPVIGDLADDLADIYRELRGGLSLYEKGFVNAQPGSGGSASIAIGQGI